MPELSLIAHKKFKTWPQASTGMRPGRKHMSYPVSLLPPQNSFPAWDPLIPTPTPSSQSLTITPVLCLSMSPIPESLGTRRIKSPRTVQARRPWQSTPKRRRTGRGGLAGRQGGLVQGGLASEARSPAIQPVSGLCQS